MLLGMVLQIWQILLLTTHVCIITWCMLIFIYSVSQKKLSPYDFCQFLPNGWEFLIEILHTYYAFKYKIDCQILSNYLQIVQSYAALSATTPEF